MERFRVELRISSKNYFRKDCLEDKLKETKMLIKSIQEQEGQGKCFYRKFPVTQNQKVYF